MVNSSSKNISSNNGTAISSNSIESSAVELEPDIRNQYPHQISQLVNLTNQQQNVASKSSFRNNFSTNSVLLISLFSLLLFATPSSALPSTTSPNVLTVLAETASACCACAVSEEDRKKTALFAVEAAMIPVLVLLSGIVAGLTLG